MLTKFPDFRQTGKVLTEIVVGGLFDQVTKCIICPFFDIPGKDSEIEGHLELVQATELRGKW